MKEGNIIKLFFDPKENKNKKGIGFNTEPRNVKPKVLSGGLHHEMWSHHSPVTNPCQL